MIAAGDAVKERVGAGDTVRTSVGAGGEDAAGGAVTTGFLPPHPVPRNTVPTRRRAATANEYRGFLMNCASFLFLD
jgi:hypothetical protein